jgi:quercetin dioxygenase-like cupin family protein
MYRTSVVSALVLACLPAASLAMDEHVAVQPGTVKWGPAPPALPPGSEAAVLSGDPASNGPYVVRVRMPANYTVPPHTHPTDENVTVIEGTLNVAMGGKLDRGKGDALGAGGFFHMPQGMQHYAWSTGPTVIQIHGMGPFAITYVNPADDPRKMTTTGSGGGNNGNSGK